MVAPFDGELARLYKRGDTLIPSLFRSAAILVAAVLAVSPVTVWAQPEPAPAACVGKPSHKLPARSTSDASITVVSFGVQGGSLRPWKVDLRLDGSITSEGITITSHRLVDAGNTLKAILALADAEQFFALHRDIGCRGSNAGPDTSARTITIRTSAGSKHVNVYGSCRPGFNQIYALLQQSAGVQQA